VPVAIEPGRPAAPALRAEVRRACRREDTHRRVAGLCGEQRTLTGQAAQTGYPRVLANSAGQQPAL